MAKTSPGLSILLIDDNQEVLNGLKRKLCEILNSSEVEIRTWLPKSDDGDPASTFRSLVDDGSTVYVATDYDLTGKGLTGLFGHTIVGWCQQRSIPVGDFSRANATALPKEPNLFELRVPPSDAEGAKFIASVFRGFRDIQQDVSTASERPESRQSLAGILANLLKRPHLESQFALYMSRLGSANSALVQRVRATAGPEVPDRKEKVQVLSYVLGHILLNAILKFPGPILSERALRAYMSTSEVEADALSMLFREASYDGPFGENEKFFWREKVDAILESFGSDISDQDFESFGDYNRAAAERRLNRKLAVHSCKRCGGRKGGFLCPFTARTLCERGDCSVSASSWIPQGAQLSRVERDFYDEWAPIFGL